MKLPVTFGAAFGGSVVAIAVAGGLVTNPLGIAVGLFVGWAILEVFVRLFS